MKKRLLSIILALCLTFTLLPITASAAGTGTLYKNFSEITNSASFSDGQTYIFLTKQYSNSDAVTTLSGGNALLTMTATSNSGGDNLTSDGYTLMKYVDVSQSGTGFDGCPSGAITYSSGAWYYWCSGGGVHHVGPFYAFTYDTVSFSDTDIVVTANRAFGATDTVAKADLTVKVQGYTVSDYTIPDSSVSTSDRQYSVDVSGVTVNLTAGYVITFTTDPNSTGTTTTKIMLTDSAGVSAPISDGSYTGHTFLGWAATSGSSVVSLTPGAILSNVDEMATFYAVWRADTYDVTYDANSGTGAPESQTKTYGVGLALSNSVPKLDGHAFVSWNTAKGGGGTSYASGATYTGNSALSLFAQWTTDTYAVIYNANGGTGAPGAQTKTYGSALTLSSTQPSRSGFTFVGWSADASAKSADYASGGSYNANEAVTLYAVWQSNADTVSYNANGGSASIATQTKTTGVDLVLSSTVPTRTGYNFCGWATSSNGNVAYNAGGLYTEEDSVVLYAVWQAYTYDVKYDDNLTGKLVTVPDTQEKTYDVSLIISNSVPAYTGYTFTGWATTSGGAVAYAPGSAYTSNAGVTLYAVWTDTKYASSTVLTSVPSTDVFVGDSVSLTATVSKTGASSVHPSGGTVTFYKGSTVLGTSLLGTDGVATYDIAALASSTIYRAVYNGNDEAYRSTNGDNEYALVVKGVVIQIGSKELTVTPDIESSGDVLTVGTQYVLTAPAVYSADDIGYATALTIDTDYTVQWYWYNGSSWCDVNSDTGHPARLTVTPSTSGQKWYAKILPAGKYTLPAAGLLTDQVTCGTLINSVTMLSANPTTAYENAVNAVTLTATVKNGITPISDGWVMFMDENAVQVGYTKLDNQGHASATVTLPAYSSGDHTAYYYASYEGTTAFNSSVSGSTATPVNVKSTSFAVPTVTATTGITTVGSTTTSAGLSGLTAGNTYTLTADAASVKGADGLSVSSGDYTFYWQKVSGGNTTTVATGSTLTFTAVSGEAYRLLVDAKNNMKIGASSYLVSVNTLATAAVSLHTDYTFLGGSDASTSAVSVNRIDGSHVGDAINLTASITGTGTVPAGSIDFYYVSGSTPVKLARVSLTEWDTNVAEASYTISGSRLSAGVYTFYAVYNGSAVYAATSYNSQYNNKGTPGDLSDDISDPAVQPFRVWSVTINSCAITASPADSGGQLSVGTAYSFTMGNVYTTDGELLALGTDYAISWYVSTNGSQTGYGAAAFTSTGSSDKSWTQTPANSSYLYKAIVRPLDGSESAKYPTLGVTANTFSTAASVTSTTLASNVSAIYEGNDIVLTATVSPTGSSVPTGTVEFYYYTTDPAHPVLINSASVATKTTASGTVYYAAIMTDALPANAGVAQNVSVYASYTGSGACSASASSATPLTVNVKSSTVGSKSVLIITANGSFSPTLSSGTIPADGSKSTLTLGTVTTKDGSTEPINESDFVITWEQSTNYSGNSDTATWTTVKTGEYIAEVAPSTNATAYRAKITPKFAEKTVMSDSAYYSNVIIAGTASSVTQMSFVLSDAPAAAGTDLTVNVKVFGGGEAPTGTVTLAMNGSPVATKDIVNGITGFSVANLAAGKYTFSASYTTTNGYSASLEEKVFYVRYAPSLELATQTYTYNAQARYYDTTGVSLSGFPGSLASSAKASVSCYYKDSTGNVTMPVDAGTYTVYAYLPETQEYAAAEATGTLVIEPKTLAVTDFITQAKTYDGTTSANVLTVDTDVIPGDSIIMGGTAVLASANAGSRTVTYTPSITGGDDAANYKLTTGYTVSKSITVARNQLAGSITSSGQIMLYKADGNTMSNGTGIGQYSVNYYYHSGSGVKAVTSTTADGKYTVIVSPNDTANYKGGLSTTMMVTSGASSYTPVICGIPVSFTISNSSYAWDGTAKKVTVTPSISGFEGYSVTYNGSGSTDTSKVGVYGVTVAVTASGYTGFAVGRMQVALANETNKATISVADKVYDGTGAVPTITNTPSGNYYVAYTGGIIKGVSYIAPKDTGTYVATLFVASTDTVTAYTASDVFTITKKTISVAANSKTREQYTTDPVWTYTVTGLALGDSSTDFITQPSIAVVSKGSNDNSDQVGTYTLSIGGAYATNYDFTYTNGILSVNSVDPNVPMTIVGLPNGAIRYGDSFKLYTYGTKGIMAADCSTVGYSDSSVINYTVVSGNATISGNILSITGTGSIVLKVTRGEGQNAVYATDSSITSVPRAVQIIPTFGTNTYDGSTTYNATGATITGLVSGGAPLVFSQIDTMTASKVNAGYYVMVISVKSGNIYSGTGAGLMLVSPAAATVTADSKTTTYGITPFPTATVTTGSLPTTPIGYSEATASSDAGIYDNFAAGVNYSKNYVVSFATGTQTVSKKTLTISAGSLDGTEYGVSTTSAIAGASFAGSGSRIYGAGNHIMDYTYATLISGDSLADLTISDGVIVSYDKDKTTDANRTYADHSAAVTGRTADYAIALGTLSAANYTFTKNPGILNIYQRNVTITSVSGAPVTKLYDGSPVVTVSPSRYVINNIVNNDLIGLVYNAAFKSGTQFTAADNAVTMALSGLSGTKILNYFLQTTSLTLAGRILAVTSGSPTNIGTDTATLNGALLNTTDATEVGFYVGASDANFNDMTKFSMSGVSSPFSQVIDSDTDGITLKHDTDYKYYSYVKYEGGSEYLSETVYFHTATGTSGVSVSLTTSSATSKNVTISILEGSNVLNATTTAASNSSSGSAAFTGLKAGVFNVTVTCDNWSDTKSVTVAEGTTPSIDFAVPANTTSGFVATSVSVDEGALNAAVDGLSDQFGAGSTLYDTEDKDAVSGGGSVDLNLNVGLSSSTTLDGTQASVFELSVKKITTTAAGQVTQTPVTELDSIIEIAVPLTSTQISNRSNLVIYREHGGSTPTEMTKLTARQTSPYSSEGYFVDFTLGYVFIYSKSFSSFYIATPATGTGGAAATAYTITVTAGKDGTISPSTTSVPSGTNQSFTITADIGNAISDVLVDGVSVGAVSKYTFENVVKEHTISAIFKDAWINPFTDVTKIDWFYDAVKLVATRDLMFGITATTFGPNISTKRAMVVTVLYRLEGSPAVANASGFKDVASGQWYSDAVAWSAANGIVKGYDADTFAPNDIITREQMAAILYRYAAYKGVDVTGTASLGKFTDAATTSDWALKSVQWAVAAGLISGTDDSKLAPTAPTTRAQLASILMRYIQNVIA